MGVTAQAMQCHIWTPCLDHVWLWSNCTARCPIWAIFRKEQQTWKQNCLSLAHHFCLPAEFTSLGQALRWCNHSNSQVRDLSTYLITQRGCPPKCSEFSLSATAHWSQASWSGDCVFLSTGYSSDHTHYSAYEQGYGNITLESVYEFDADTTLPVVMLHSMTFTLLSIITALGFFHQRCHILLHQAPVLLYALHFRWNATY